MPEQLNNKPELNNLRKSLRNNATPEENLLWEYLKGKKLMGKKFRRQHSFGYYILDFYCPTEKLAIELDGYQHFTEEGKANDKERDDFLKAHGIRVLRMQNSELKDMTSVMKKITAFLTSPGPS